MIFPDGQYAASDGWVASMDIVLDIGTVFEWMSNEWEVVVHFNFPCCGHQTTAVRKVGSNLHIWRGIGPCPSCNCSHTYTIQDDYEVEGLKNERTP